MPGWAVSMAEGVQRRFHRRFQLLTGQGKRSPVATVAVARELVGCLWAVLGRSWGPCHLQVDRPLESSQYSTCRSTTHFCRLWAPPRLV